jgi:GNAT superfamily N-acetyltransferase
MIEPAPCTDAALAAAVALERTILEGAADEVRVLDTGVALAQPALPDAALVNQVVADPVAIRALGADALVDDLGGRLRLWVPDDELGRGLAPVLADHGFCGHRDVVLVHDGPHAAGDPDDGGVARAVRRPAARRLEREILGREGARPRDVTRLLVLRDALGAAVPVDHVIAGDAAHAAVYAADGVAKVADVATLPRERGRGLAGAAVAHAVARAHAAGHEHVVAALPAQSGLRGAAARLGFRLAGGWWRFARVAG